jgi:glycosyltransferase involved in cell wall biosynthesis
VDPPARGVSVLGRRLALLDRARELLLDLADALVQRALVDLADHDLEARLRRDLGDAVAHEPAAENADLRDVRHSFPPVRERGRQPTLAPPVATVLYVYPRSSSFIAIDRDALAADHELLDWEQPGRVANLVRLIALLRRADAVVGWWASWHTFFPITLAWLARKPSLLIVGGFDVAAVPEVGFGYQLGGLRKWASRWIIARATRLVTNSHYSREEVARNIGPRTAARVRVIHHGIPDPFGTLPAEEEREPIALTVGGVTALTLEQKGQRPFVEAAGLLPEVRWVQAGAWLEPAAVERLRAAAPANVELRGWLGQDELERLYGHASVYVQASWHEGFGMAVAEAMLAGCVPVVRDAGAMPEVVGDAGVLIHGSEPARIADGVRRALAAGPEGRRAARERILREFPLAARGERLRAEVREMLASRRR